MAQKPDHKTAHSTAHSTPHSTEHEGSSVGFYIFIALILGVITYVEFALVEHKETWFAALSSPLILALLIGLSVVKFIMVVMFFMHLKGDDRTFTGFFSSGMVIAVGTLFALSALFTVRSVANAQTPPADEPSAAAAEEAGGTEGGGEVADGIAHRSEYPPPKTLNTEIIDITPPGQIITGGSIVDNGSENAALLEGERTTGGIPLAPPPGAVTLTDPFSLQAPETQTQPTNTAAAPAATPAAPAAAPPAAGAPAAAPPAGAPPSGPLLVDADLNAGEAIFVANCSSCHQATGQGIPGAFPPLVAHAPELAVAAGGYEYLENLLLYGLQGEINVAGSAYNGVMPAWGQLTDQELADVLNYVTTAWGNADAMPPDYPAFTAENVAAQRDAALSSAQVYELRQTLGLP